MNVLDFQKKKDRGEKISMITCYDYSFARIIGQTEIDCVLVGDSLAMVMHGNPDTLGADTELIALHVRAVRKGAPEKFIIADMPFLSFRKGLSATMDNVETLIKSGANAVKVEGAYGNLEIIRYIVESGIPVMGHLGMTPQSVNKFGGFCVQGREDRASENLINQANSLERAGCFCIVLECIPTDVATAVSEGTIIPTIGIGAGAKTDGQVLVLQDLLGMDPNFRPKFVRQYLNGVDLITTAVNNFHQEVREAAFPQNEESY